MDIVDLQSRFNQNQINCIKRLLNDKQGFERVLDNLHNIKYKKHNNAYIVVTYNKQGYIDIVCVTPTVSIKSTTFGNFISQNFNGASVEIGLEPRDNTLYKIKVRSYEKNIDVNWHMDKFIEVLDYLMSNKNISTQNISNKEDNTKKIVYNTINKIIENHKKRLQTLGMINKNSNDYKITAIKIQTLKELLVDLNRDLGRTS